MWLHSLKVAQLLRSAACLHTNQSRSYLNHLALINVALRCFRVTVVAMEEQDVTYSECVYSLGSSAHKSTCAMLSLYYHLRTVRLYQIFPHYLMNGAILGKKLLNIKCVF